MSAHEPKNPRVVLLEDHRHIDRLLDRLVAVTRADERDACAKLWAKVEKVILAHLDVEEMFVFPAIAETHGPEVERLRREHAAIRREVGEIGIALDLHIVRAETIEAFCASLREHAAREESLAYAQAERKLTANIARAIVDRIRSPVGPRRMARSRPTSLRGAP